MSGNPCPDFTLDGGTGSTPARAKGWQRNSREAASRPPRTTPWHSTASIAYCEQVGTKRQECGSMGEMTR